MRHLPILLFVFCSALYSQNYQFDKLITYEVSLNEIQSTHQKVINSKNSNYNLFLTGNLAELFDSRSLVKHFFEITYLENHISLKYVRSCNESENFKKANEEKWDYRVEKINDNEFLLGKYKSQKAKNPLFLSKIKIEESTVEGLNDLHPIEKEFRNLLNSHLDKDKIYSITEVGFYSNGKIERNLKLIQTAYYELDLSLPEQLNYDCLNNIP